MMQFESKLLELRKQSDSEIGQCWQTSREVSSLLEDHGVPHSIMCGGILAQLEGVESSAEDCKAVGSNHYWVETPDGTVLETHSESEWHYDEVLIGERPENYVVYDDSTTYTFQDTTIVENSEHFRKSGRTDGDRQSMHCFEPNADTKP